MEKQKNKSRINTPLVTIHVCTYNRADKISKALDSILIQNYSNLQILVLDDSSTDNTQEIVNEYLKKDSRIEYHRNEENLGITENRNKALSLSKGKYVAVLDSDDYWINENKITEQVEFLENNPDYAIVGTYTQFVNEKEELVKEFKPQTENEKIKNKILIQNPFVHSSVLYKKGSFNEYQHTEHIACEDYNAWLEIGKTQKLKNIPEFYTTYLVHSTNVSNGIKFKGLKSLGKLVREYKNIYPNYWLANLKHKLRFVRVVLKK